MSLFELKFSQMILHTETSKLMYNWSFRFVVLHKPILLPSTFKGVLKLLCLQIHFDGVNFSECCSEEVISFFLYYKAKIKSSAKG